MSDKLEQLRDMIHFVKSKTPFSSVRKNYKENGRSNKESKSNLSNEYYHYILSKVIESEEKNLGE